MENDITEIWKLYQRGVDYFNRMNLYSQTEEAHRFYSGDQWAGLESGGERMPVLNVIQPTVEYKVATVAQNNMAISYTDMQLTADRQTKWLCETLDSYAAQQWERKKMEKKSWEVVKAAAIAGDSYLFFYDGEGSAQVIANTDIHLADEQNPDLQQQQYIILSERRTIAELRERAEKNGISEDGLELIQPDEPEHKSDAAGSEGMQRDEKCTSLLYMEKKDGVVHITRATRQLVYQKDTPVEAIDSDGKSIGKLTQYPIVGLVWKRKKGSARGAGEVKEIIPNQIEINRLFARRLINAKITAFARLVYNGQTVENPDELDEVGSAIEVNGSAQNVRDMVTYLNPAPMSGDAKTLTDELIRQTRELAGAGDAAVGQVDPTQASGAAIMAVQEQAALPLNEQIADYKQFCEDIASVWFAVWVAYNPDGLTVKTENEQGELEPVWLSADSLQRMRVHIRIDISPNNPYSKMAQETALKNLFDARHITFEEYVDALDDKSTMPKAKLTEIIKNRQLQMRSRAAATGGEPNAMPIMQDGFTGGQTG